MLNSVSVVTVSVTVSVPHDMYVHIYSDIRIIKCKTDIRSCLQCMVAALTVVRLMRGPCNCFPRGLSHIIDTSGVQDPNRMLTDSFYDDSVADEPQFTPPRQPQPHICVTRDVFRRNKFDSTDTRCRGFHRFRARPACFVFPLCGFSLSLFCNNPACFILTEQDRCQPLYNIYNLLPRCTTWCTYRNKFTCTPFLVLLCFHF